MSMRLTFELEQEVDGRWIAEILELPGVLAYGATQSDAIEFAKALAFKVIADRVEHREMSGPDRIEFVRAA
jgi:predicted RNase H-like HicB family nuclease